MRLECYAAAGQTLVPNVFIDKYMTEASGEFVKIYLCLLRLQGTAEIDVRSLAERLDLTERTVNRGLAYLEKCGLLKLFYDAEGTLNGIRILSGADDPGETSLLDVDRQESSVAKAKPAPEVSSAAGLQEQAGQTAAVQTAPPAAKEKAKRRHYLPSEVSRLCEEDGEFNMLITVVAPAYLERPLTHTDNEIFAYLHQDISLPVDVLEYCIEQCVERKRDERSKNQFMRYIERTALNWQEEGVRTLEDARAAVARFDEKLKGSAEAAAAGGDNAAQPARKKRTTGRSAKIQAAYGFSTERDNVDYNALAWSRMWEEK